MNQTRQGLSLRLSALLLALVPLCSAACTASGSWSAGLSQSAEVVATSESARASLQDVQAGDLGQNPEDESEWAFWSRFGRVVEGLLVAAIVALVGGLVGAALKYLSTHRSEVLAARRLLHAPTSGRPVRGSGRSLLEPCPSFDAESAAERGRVPLRVRGSPSRLVRQWRRLRCSLLRPSSPKPAFVLRGWHFQETALVPGADFDDIRAESIVLHYHSAESREHFSRTLRSNVGFPWRSARTVFLGSLDEFVADRGALKRVVVDTRNLRYSQDRSDTVMMYAFAQCPSGSEASDDEIPRSAAGASAVWLLTDASGALLGAECSEPYVRSVKPGSEERFMRRIDSLRPLVMSVFRKTRAHHDPPTRRRVWRRALAPLIFLAPLVGSLFWPGEAIITEPSAIRVQAFNASAVILWIGGLMYMACQASSFLFLELTASPLWSSTTTRCMEDGKSTTAVEEGRLGA